MSRLEVSSLHELLGESYGDSLKGDVTASGGDHLGKAARGSISGFPGGSDGVRDKGFRDRAYKVLDSTSVRLSVRQIHLWAQRALLLHPKATVLHRSSTF